MTDSISILIIGGKSDLKEELTSNLRKTGFTVTVMLGYIEARWILDHLYPDMIIMDEVMPHGLRDTVACFRLHHDYGIPVILLCKDACGEPWIGVAENGADFYFTRPSDHQELVDRMKAILERSKKGLVATNKAAIDGQSALPVPGPTLYGGWKTRRECSLKARDLLFWYTPSPLSSP